MIPAAVSKVFETYQNTEELSMSESNQPVLVERHSAPVNQIIKLVLMHDDLGRVQVIVPADCLLDVDVLNKSIGRSLVASTQEEVINMTERYSMNALPALPDITGLPAIIDERVLALSEVFVESDQTDQVIKLSSDLFKISVKKAKPAKFVVPIADIVASMDKPKNDIDEINHAIEKFTSLRIKQRLEDTLELPPLPQSAQDIIRLRSNPDASADELADIIERDPSLSAQVVSWASSSFYNAPGKIRSVHDAIIRVLGFDMVMNLAMGLALGRTLNVPSDEPEGYLPYWHQAMWMALGTTSLISKVEPAYRPSFGLSYLSGLLHNFGYLVLAHIFPPHFTLICRYIEANPHVDQSIIEHHLLGITSEQVGSQLMSVWNMPAEVITALRHQKHEEYDNANAEYAQILNLTHQLLAKHDIIRSPSKTVNSNLLEKLHLAAEDAEEAIGKLLETKDEVSAVANQMSR